MATQRRKERDCEDRWADIIDPYNVALGNRHGAGIVDEDANRSIANSTGQTRGTLWVLRMKFNKLSLASFGSQRAGERFSTTSIASG